MSGFDTKTTAYILNKYYQYIETNDLNTLIVGKNNSQKNNIEKGKANNQNLFLYYTVC